ncbi:MAG: terminase [Lachnospiraceae bacterium]|nr:terminase [Lachnospiraceae bacterium]
MPRKPDKRIEQAQVLYLKGLKLVDISKQLDLPEGTIRCWKNRYKWNATLQKNKCNVAKNKGAPSGNKNASGHGAPEKNSNAEKHGLFRKYLPEETFSIIDEMKDKSPLDLIWDAIQIQYAAIIRSQQIMYVKDREDKTVEKVEQRTGNIIGETWEVQQAWDKQASFLKAQSTAITSLKNLVKDYLELEGASKSDAKEQAKDWKTAIIEIAKRRKEKMNGRPD